MLVGTQAPLSPLRHLKGSDELTSFDEFSGEEVKGYIVALAVTGVLTIACCFATVDHLVTYMRYAHSRRTPHRRIRCGRCCTIRLDFRVMVMTLVLLSLFLKLIWLVDPVGLHDLFPKPVRLMVLRISQILLLECVALVGVMWKRLAIAQARFQKIKSVIVVGKYKRELAIISVSLLMLLVVALIGSLDIEEDIMELATRVLFGVFLLCLFSLALYSSCKIRRAVRDYQSIKRFGYITPDGHEQVKFSLRSQALDFFRKKRTTNTSLARESAVEAENDPPAHRRSGSWGARRMDPVGSPLSPGDAGTPIRGGASPKMRSTSIVSKLRRSVSRALFFWTTALIIWLTSFGVNMAVAEGQSELSKPVYWGITYFSLLRFIEILTTYGIIVSVSTPRRTTPRCKPVALDLICGWTCWCFAKCHSRLNNEGTRIRLNEGANTPSQFSEEIDSRIRKQLRKHSSSHVELQPPPRRGRQGTKPQLGDVEQNLESIVPNGAMNGTSAFPENDEGMQQQNGSIVLQDGHSPTGNNKVLDRQQSSVHSPQHSARKTASKPGRRKTVTAQRRHDIAKPKHGHDASSSSRHPSNRRHQPRRHTTVASSDNPRSNSVKAVNDCLTAGSGERIRRQDQHNQFQYEQTLSPLQQFGRLKSQAPGGLSEGDGSVSSIQETNARQEEHERRGSIPTLSALSHQYSDSYDDTYSSRRSRSLSSRPQNFSAPRANNKQLKVGFRLPHHDDVQPLRMQKK